MVQTITCADYFVADGVTDTVSLLLGRILKAVGYRNCLSLCFLVYTLRLGLFSVISNPWWALGIELLQGPSYALSYTTIVAYASAISPPGTSATMQGIAAGVDDGFGMYYSILLNKVEQDSVHHRNY